MYGCWGFVCSVFSLGLGCTGFNWMVGGLLGRGMRHVLTAWRVIWSRLVAVVSKCFCIMIILGMRVGETA